MSYCVNCGVELGDSAKSCPLCSTEVINPNKKSDTVTEPSPFSEEVHIPEGVKARFTALIISVVMLIPNIVCGLTNALFFKDSLWSLYVVSTSALLWIVFVLPFFKKRRKTYLMWAADTIGAILYAYFLYVVSDSSIDWFMRAYLPIILVISAVVLIYIVWVRKKKRHAILKALHIVSDFAAVSLASSLLLLQIPEFKALSLIAMMAFVSFVVMIGFFTYCYNSKSMRRYLSKKLFV